MAGFQLRRKIPLSSPGPAWAFRLWPARASGAAEPDAPRGRTLKDALNAAAPLGPLYRLLRALLRRPLSRKHRANPLPGPRYVAIYTNISRDSFDAEGNYRDVFFGDLIPEIRRRA